MPKNWKTYKLGELAHFKNGKTRPSEKGTYPVYGGNGILDYANEFNSEGETSIVGRVGAYCGSVYFDDKPLWISDNAIDAKPKGGNSAKFLYYLLKQMGLNKFAEGSSHPLLTQTILNELEVIAPDLRTQSQIASILSSLDNKIELNLQMNQTLEAMAQAIFKEWFVDFRFPGSTKKLVNNLPKGWRVGTISEIYKTTSGGTPSRAKEEYYVNGSIKWVKSKELNGSFIFETEEKITDEAVKNSSAKKVPRHSVLIAMYGATVGEYGVLSSEATCNQAICAIIPNDKYPYTYILEYLKINKEKIIDQASGSAQQNISQALIQRQEILIPTPEIVNSYHQAVNPLFEKIESNLATNQTLTQIRDSLLPNLMNGTLSVP
jgi:type I restriction enzyme, S subunit